MLRGRDVQELTELQRQGMSIQGISKLTGWDRKTVRKYLLQPNALPEYGPRRRQASKLDPFKPAITELLQRDPTANAPVIAQRLRPLGYDGGITIIKDHLRAVRRSSVGRRAYVRVEPEPCSAKTRSRSFGPSPSRWVIANA